MSRFHAVFKQLDQLQSRLKSTANRLWSINLSLASAYRLGHRETDFLPRRLLSRKKEIQREYEQLLHQLNRFVSSHLDSAFITFSSAEDVEAAGRIRTTIRYIQNAFGGELPLRHVLARLNTMLDREGKGLKA